MAQLVIPAAGATLGWFIGGPMGASVGWMLGSAFSASKTQKDIAMPTIGDLRVQTSAYGVPIPLLTGTQRIAGNIIWSTDKVAHQTSVSQGGGGKGFGGSAESEVTVTTYSISMAIALCKGPILGISRVWTDGELAATVNTGQSKLPGKLYLGTNTQTPDPTIVAAEGSGNVPAYRGLAYIVLTDFDLGASGRVPMFSFEILKQEVL